MSFFKNKTYSQYKGKQATRKQNKTKKKKHKEEGCTRKLKKCKADRKYNGGKHVCFIDIQKSMSSFLGF